MIARHDNDRPEPTRDERVERYAEAIKDGLYLACPHCVGRGWTVEPNHWDGEAEQVQCERCAYLHSGLNPSPGAEREAAEITARATLALADAELAEKDATIAALRAEVEDLHKRLADGERTFAECFARWKACEKGRDELKAALARVEALCEAEDARVAEANRRYAERGDLVLKTGRPIKVVGILPVREIRKALRGEGA